MFSRLADFHFDNSFSRLPEAFYTRVEPQALINPRLAAFSPAAAALCDAGPGLAQDPALVELLAGRSRPEAMAPLAMVYAGHQFGSYNPRLGDGRGLLLGETVNTAGERWDWHLKGAGLTPYSRFGDGRAVLRSSVREFLGSEALAGLGIPTTRALAVVVSDTPVIRETVEPGASLLRLARSHVRFGHFEYFAYTGQVEAMRHLLDYVIARHFPECREAENPVAALFARIVESTARLIGQWQAVGFTHGVMNTDNLSILGETFDYGPFAFFDAYQAGFVPNHSDHSGRYAFNQQPGIGYWNCACLARALCTLSDAEPLKAVLESYEGWFVAEYSRRMRAKFGLENPGQETPREGDRELILDGLELLEQQGVDYTRFMRALGDFDREPGNPGLRAMFHEPAAFDAWSGRYRARLAGSRLEAQARRDAMARSNPKYILRTHLAQAAIQALQEDGDPGVLERLRRALVHPFDEQDEFEDLASEPPASCRSIVLSCSS